VVPASSGLRVAAMPEPPESKEVGKSPITYAGYLALEEESDGRNEFIDGRIVPVAGASIEHARLVKNLLVTLTDQLVKRCEPLPGPRVYVPLTGDALYPDVIVFCDREKRHQVDTGAITNPKVIIEVLSHKSTARFDRTGKFELYKSIPSFKEYVLLSQRETLIEVLRRGKGDIWSPPNVCVSGTIELKSIKCLLDIDTVYAKTGIP
jgi:Uma2 family endonuclease